MKREILCTACSKGVIPMHPQDALAGFRRRITPLVAKKPQGHGITSIVGDNAPEFRPMRRLVCDHCDTEINDGADAVAVTWWNEHREGEPFFWEEEYKV